MPSTGISIQIGSRIASIALILLVSVTLTVTLIAAGTAFANTGDDYDVSVPGALETPEQTTSFEGNDYTVTGLAELAPGESLTASITVPDSEEYTLELITSDTQRETAREGSGSETVTFETSSLESGSYVLALEVDGDYVDAFPVVINGYDISLEHASEFHPDHEYDVTVSVSETTASGAPDAVEVVVWNEDTAERILAQQTGDGMYQASVSGLEDGSYNVYAVAQGDEEFRGEPEVLGVGHGSSLEVTESTSTPEPPANGDDGENDVTETPTDEPTETENSTETENTTETDTTPIDDGTATENTSNSTETVTETETEQNVVTPNETTDTATNETDTDTETDDDSLSVMAVPILAAILLLVTLGLRVATRRSS